MTIRDALREGYSILRENKNESPYLDTCVLLSEATGRSKENLFASLSDNLPSDYYSRFLGFLELRCRGVPVSYIRRKKEFFSLDFVVDQRVFVPRPETEVLVEAVLAHLGELGNIEGLSLHDCCTGTGCIAIAVKSRFPDLRVSASDISPQVQELFNLNTENLLGEALPFKETDLLSGIGSRFDIITANPPYLTHDAARTMKENGWPEPVSALDGGEYGLDLTLSLISQSPNRLKKEGRLYLEADPEQMSELENAMSAIGFSDILCLNDLRGSRRVICGVQ